MAQRPIAAPPKIAVLVSSYHRPGHLQRVLASIAAQRGVEGQIEVVVTDDGSQDETEQLVRRFAAHAAFPVHFTTHPHDGFQLARCRNEGVAASTAPYLLFLDGDCLIPPDHLQLHLARSRPGYAMAGYCALLDEQTSRGITEEQIRAGQFRRWDTWTESWKLWKMHAKARFYESIGDRLRPKLFGGNIGIARADYERVNGYDESFVGWGCEDDDLRLRLRAAGIRVGSILGHTHTYHLWHPKAPSAPRTWSEGANVDYLKRPLRLTRCLSGLSKRRLQDIVVRIAGNRPSKETLDRTLPLWCRVALATPRETYQSTEIELAFAPSSAPFSRESNCRILLVPKGARAPQSMVRQADLIFADGEVPSAPSKRTFTLDALDPIVQQQLGLRRGIRGCAAQAPSRQAARQPASVG